MHHLDSLFLAHASAHGLSASAESAAHSSGSGLLVVILLILLVLIGLVVLMVVSMWKIFKKAGRPGWASIVPFYNHAVILEILRKPLWWLPLLFFVPVVNLILLLILARRLAAVFGKGRWFTAGLIFLPFIFMPILAFGNAPYDNKYQEAPPMSEAVKWSLIVGVLFVLFELVFLGMSLSGAESGSSKPLTVLSSGSSGDDGGSEGYATDGTYVYYYDAPLDEADPASFEIKGDGYSVDDYSVYYYGDRLSEADPSTFEILGESGYAKDNTHVYYGKDIVVDADPTTFSSIQTDYGSYGADTDHVYDEGVLIKGADPATFEALDASYSKDATSVYYFSGDSLYPSVIVGADPATFEILDSYSSGSETNYDAKDKSHYYIYGKVATGK